MHRYKRGRKSIPQSLVNARREFVAGLRSTGMNNPDIHKQVNAMANEREWGEVSSRTVERDIVKFYEERNPITPEDYEMFFNLREANLAQLELIIEKMSIHIMRKKEWKPFEYISALAKLFNMQYKYMTLQNWNYTKKNMDFDFRHRHN